MQHTNAPSWCGQEVSECLLRQCTKLVLVCSPMHQVGAAGCCFYTTPPIKDSSVLGRGRLMPNSSSCRFPVHVFWICIFFCIFYTYQTTCIVIRQDAKSISRRTIFALSFCFIRKRGDLYSIKVTGYKTAWCL
jgi:hypothetical protein